jgi:hypothetical protein
MSVTPENSKPPVLSTLKRYKSRGPLGFILLTLLVVAVFSVLFIFDPAQHAFYPGCALYKLTGLYCPGCGGLRATHQLLHGRLLAAFHFNPLFIVALPLLFWAFARATSRYFRGESFVPALRPNWLWSSGVAILLFGIIRNLPFAAFAWMRP